ncbi:MAG: 2-oxoacid:acceptor oxidoreductase family protein [Planctomycetes bacterium]|nr:2-oxoacid:acceptor oxidoreductase family protein [Planctomycetota bacterium]
MEMDAIFAGFGGQGIMLVGQMVSYAALAEGKQTSWLPSYGPEMRGGTANCTVIVSDTMIGSPVVSSPKTAVVMNPPSYTKFGNLLRPDGILIVNTSLIKVDSDDSDIQKVKQQTDIQHVELEAYEIASEIGNRLGANMVILGAFVASRPGTIKPESIETLITWYFKEKKGKSDKIVDMNHKCFHAGIKIVEKILANSV